MENRQKCKDWCKYAFFIDGANAAISMVLSIFAGAAAVHFLYTRLAKTARRHLHQRPAIENLGESFFPKAVLSMFRSTVL